MNGNDAHWLGFGLLGRCPHFCWVFGRDFVGFGDVHCLIDTGAVGKRNQGVTVKNGYIKHSGNDDSRENGKQSHFWVRNCRAPAMGFSVEVNSE